MNKYDSEFWINSISANNGKPYQQCSISVMDTISDPDIFFDKDGICNYYHEYKVEEHKLFQDNKDGNKLSEIVEVIKKSGAKNKYDCITGVSGGVDSTYLALQAKKLGLRPLIVHFDNSWNSEIAVKNIENIISKLGFDLYTLVVDWEEFRDLQLAYLKASVVDIEAITDHAIMGTIYKLAAQNNIKYILSGNNLVTEYVLPGHWIFNKADHINIQAIHKVYGNRPLKTYPFYDNRAKHYYKKVKGIQTIQLLDFLHYDKREVKETIIKELNWKDYGGKHYESVFTRFYQGYILPVKFGIDKRKAHLSNLIFSNQMSKQTAMQILQQPIYDEKQLSEDYEFVLKKFGLNDEEFKRILNQPRREHTEFDYDKGFFKKHPYLQFLQPLWKNIQKKGITDKS